MTSNKGFSLGVACTLAVIFVGACAVRAPRSTGMGQESPVESSELGLDEVEGLVTHVDPSTGKISIQGEAGVVDLRINEDTHFFHQGNVAALEDIVEGSEVRATFSLEGFERIATWVEVPRVDTDALPQEGEEGQEGDPDGEPDEEHDGEPRESPDRPDFSFP